MNGEYAYKLSCKILPFVKELPFNGKLILLNPVNDNLEYSIYLINDFNLFKYGIYYLNEISGRDDFETVIVEQSDIEDIDINDEKNVILTIANDDVVKYTEP